MLLQYLRDLFGNMPEQVSALLLSGAAGAYVRAVFAPEASWRRRILEGLAGAFSAVFLGGLVGHVLQDITGGGTWAYLAAGFIMGEGGIAAVRGFRKFLFKGDPK
ncbi:hypothetical protein [Roseovarius indicus]|uniref:Holin n=1 Tax=Roseovarius indicus TaxID=540747 RepID=A0A0T5P8X2_9RHOB|nr:hypothetical protein [Roseovarius indicus]KRS17541.1 hypothetical protein XM52_13785 [Roseovarius indicus]QEW26748.1 hypothetical protein RIdsm_02550 [Roseovarius indicus]SFD60704.1 hypothetical protein SAMN04488031_101793 [Roseovarius indicus]